MAGPSTRDRLLIDREVARLLRRSITWLSAHRAELEAAGFPKRLPVVGRYDPVAIRAWLDRQGGINPAEREAAERRARLMARADAWGTPLRRRRGF